MCPFSLFRRFLVLIMLQSKHFISACPQTCSELREPNILTVTSELVKRTVQSEGLVLFFFWSFCSIFSLELHAHCACFREPTHYWSVLFWKDDSPVCSVSATPVLGGIIIPAWSSSDHSRERLLLWKVCVAHTLSFRRFIHGGIKPFFLLTASPCCPFQILLCLYQRLTSIPKCHPSTVFLLLWPNFLNKILTLKTDFNFT